MLPQCIVMYQIPEYCCIVVILRYVGIISIAESTKITLHEERKCMKTEYWALKNTSLMCGIFWWLPKDQWVETRPQGSIFSDKVPW